MVHVRERLNAKYVAIILLVAACCLAMLLWVYKTSLHTDKVVLSVEPTKDVFRSSEYAFFTVKLTNNTNKLFNTPFGTCAQRHEIFVDDIRVHKISEAVCAIGWSGIGAHKTVEQDVKLNFKGLQKGRHAFSYKLNPASNEKFLAASTTFRISRDKRKVDCYSFIAYENTNCSQLTVMTRIYRPNEYRDRCEGIKKRYFSRTRFNPIPSQSTMVCSNKQPFFVFNVPKANKKKDLEILTKLAKDDYSTGIRDEDKYLFVFYTDEWRKYAKLD